jgi:hypothetical protein
MRRAIHLFVFLLAANVPSLHAAPPASYRIAGIIVDSVTGQPLEAAEVSIAPVTDLDDQRTFLTSSDGRFLFTDLPRGKYRLTASCRGYALQALDEHEGYSTAVAVSPGLDSEHIRFRLAPSAVLTGVVTDEWGDPVRDAKVLLFQRALFNGEHTTRNVGETMTDDQGRYRFAHLRAGSYAVAVYAKPWYTQPRTPFVTRSLGEQSGTETLATSVREDAPTPVPAGVLDFASNIGVVYPVTFFPNATRLSDAAAIALSAGTSQTADFQLHTVPSIHLRVRVPVQPPVLVTVTSETASAAGDNQEISNNTSEVEQSAAVDLTLRIGHDFSEQLQPDRNEVAPGIIELSGIPPGEMNLVATSFVGANGGDYVSRSKTVTISEDGEVNFAPPGVPVNVSGVVVANQFSVAASPAPASPDQLSPEHLPSNLTLSFRSLASGETYDAPISTTGKFSFPGSQLSAGSYEVELLSQGDLRVSSVEATGATVSGRTIEIPAGQPVTLVVHTAEAKCSLSGYALKNGKPLAGVMLLLVPQDPGHGTSLYHRDQSDSDGSFFMSPLFPGKYTLLAIENGWNLKWSDPAVPFRYLPSGQPVTLALDASFSLNAKVQ